MFIHSIFILALTLWNKENLRVFFNIENIHDRYKTLMPSLKPFHLQLVGNLFDFYLLYLMDTKTYHTIFKHFRTPSHGRLEVRKI